MKLFDALASQMKRNDTTANDRFEYNKVKLTIETLCSRYLSDVNDIFIFEAMPSVIDNVLACLESQDFLEAYEFQQVSETCFAVKLHEVNLLG